LLEVARVSNGVKEIIDLRAEPRRALFVLDDDPAELISTIDPASEPSELLTIWLDTVREGLRRTDRLGEVELDQESIEQLRSLGYLE